jgi:5-methylcytosine-specific restriction endonuclease McrA
VAVKRYRFRPALAVQWANHHFARPVPNRRRGQTRERRDALIVLAGGCCLYCGDPATTIDHFWPAAYSGPEAFRVGNLVPACAACNTHKGAQHPHAWMHRYCAKGTTERVLAFLRESREAVS